MNDYPIIKKIIDCHNSGQPLLGVSLEFNHFLDDSVIIKEGYLNQNSPYYFTRDIEDDEERFRYVCDRASQGSATGIRNKIIE